MPGPLSKPHAIDPATGRKVTGKTALRDARLTSRQGVTKPAEKG